jgi:chromatin remodeling complex protein RSC6
MEKSKTGLAAPVNISDDLAAIIGQGPMPRTEVTKALWVYIKEHNLQDPNNKRNILPDEKLKKVFDGVDSLTMFEMAKYVSKHVTKA